MKSIKQLNAALLIIAAIGLFSCTKNDVIKPSTNDAEQKMDDDGYVYSQSNTFDSNRVYVFAQNRSTGALTLDQTIGTGGAGADASLGSQGSVTLNENHSRLLVVNAGDNTVSSFRVDEEGQLQLASVVNSQGLLPVSVAVYKNWVYVVNFGSDAIAGFTMDNSGSLSPLGGSVMPLSGSGVEPAEILFSPNGRVLYVTEKATSMITSYIVNDQGLPVSSVSHKSKGIEPFGFCFVNDNSFVVSNAANGVANASSCTNYFQKGMNGILSVDGPVPNQQTAACWVSAPKNKGKYVYVSNTGSNTISTYSFGAMGMLNLVMAVATTTQESPIDNIVSGDNENFVYNVNQISQTISGYKRNPDGSLSFISSIGDLAPFTSGLAGY